ncbi:MAG: site-2 protease family protein [Planctomycetota bacterium]|nr:site-2 protease family protein [Planctomycetota bacterium]
MPHATMEILTNGWNVLVILLGFGVLIFIHELGHFMAARWAGIRCESFSVGMGPVLGAWRSGIGWRAGSTDPATIARFGKPAIEMTDEELARNGIGETEWSLRALPLGGYVRMLGQDDLDPAKVSEARRSFQRAPVWKRMIVVTAGVTCNLVLAIAMFVFTFMVGVRFEAPVVGGVVAGSPASSAESATGGPAGLKAGDAITAIDGEPVLTFADIQIAGAMARPGEALTIDVQRVDETGLAVARTFRIIPRKDAITGLLAIGIEPAMSGMIGAVRGEEREIFDSTMSSAGLGPVVTGTKSDALRSLTKVMEPTAGNRVMEARAVMQQYMPVATGERASDSPSVTMLLSEAAERSAGTPFDTEWTTASGAIVTRKLQPIPELQVMITPASVSNELEIDRGLLGLVPLIRVERVPPGSANEATLRAGDVLLRVADVDGPRMSQLRAALTGHASGTVDIVVLRGGEPTRLTAHVDRSGRFGVVIAPALNNPATTGTIDRLATEATATGVARPSAVAALKLLPRTAVRSVAGTPVTDWTTMRAALLLATQDAATRGESASVTMEVEAPTPAHERSQVVIALTKDDVVSIHALGWDSPVTAAIFDPLMTRLTANGNPLTAVRMGFHQTKTMVVMTYLTLDRIFRGSVGVEQLRGPVGIVHLGSRVVDRGLMYLVFFLAMISVNLAVLNFLPLPIVDGGLFLYLIYEHITGRAPSLKFQNAATMVGLLLLGSLFLFTFYNDVMRLFVGG